MKSALSILETKERFAVLGLGRSGVAAANLLARLGRKVLASDTRDGSMLADAVAMLDPRVEVVLGQNTLGDAQIVVASPGLKPSLAVFSEAARSGIHVISEIELAFLASNAPFVAITGTDGKTTTTSLTGAMFEAAGREHVVAGNIGTPLCEVISSLPSHGVVVAEVSAFQLWSTHVFRAHSSAVTNIAGDHLDYFDGDFLAYTNAKKSLLERGLPTDWAMLRLEDPVVSSWAKDWPGRVCFYGLSAPKDKNVSALWSDGDTFYGRFDGVELGSWLKHASLLPLRGPHNQANMLCAAALALSMGVGLDAVQSACVSFKPLPHRMEPVHTTRSGTTFWNDSKATNAHAALAGLRGLQGRYVAIVGGVDKGLDLSGLVDELTRRAHAVVSIGALQKRLRQELEAQGMAPDCIHEVGSMREAVQHAYDLASPLGVDISLSPACSSFDMFSSYAERGDIFEKEVRLLSF